VICKLFVWRAAVEEKSDRRNGTATVQNGDYKIESGRGSSPFSLLTTMCLRSDVQQIENCALSPDHTLLATGGLLAPDVLHVIDVATKAETHTVDLSSFVRNLISSFVLTSRKMRSAAWSPDGQLLVALARDGNIFVVLQHYKDAIVHRLKTDVCLMLSPLLCSPLV